MRITTRCSLSILALASAVPAIGANVLVDGGFETTTSPIPDNGGINQWGNFNVTAGNVEVQDAIVQAGTYAMEFNVVPTGSQGFSVVYQNTGTAVTTVQDEWFFSFQVYRPSTTTSGSFNYAFLSSNAGNVDIYEAGGNGTIQATDLVADTWTEITGSFIVTEAGSDRLKALFSQDNSTGTFIIDEVVLDSVPEPSVPVFSVIGLLILVVHRRRR